MRVNLQPSYILHSRPYRDSSSLLEVFTAEYGRLSLVARGGRRSSRGGSKAALLQPFTPLLLSFSGRAEMKNLGAAESAGAAISLQGERLFSGLYINELLSRLLHRHDPHPGLFAAYSAALESLLVCARIEDVLRRFEYTLLDELGYSFDLACDAVSGEPVEVGQWYQYHPGLGLVCYQGVAEPSSSAYAGDELLRMADGDFGEGVRSSAKRLLRQALAEHIGDAPLRSRELFRSSRRASVTPRQRPGGNAEGGSST